MIDQDVTVEHNSTCSFQSLPEDVLIAIFSRLYSLADLSSVVSASRSLHECFQLHMRAIFLGMLSYDFVPVMRDAVAAATTQRTPPLTWWGREQRIRLAMQRCQSLGRGPKSTAELQIYEIINAVRLKTAAWYLADLFFELRRRDLRVISPVAAAPLSSHERQRLSAAFLRHQLATTLHPSNARMTDLLAPFFSAFAAWEAEQIHQANLFITQLCIAMDSLQTDDTQEPSSHVNRRYLNGHMYDLVFLCKAFRSAIDDDPGLMSRVSEKVEERSVRGLYGGLGFLNASHDFPNDRMGSRTYSDQLAETHRQMRGLRSELYVKERSMPALVAGPSVADPPFGWVDALDGLDCCRWGRDLPYSSPCDITSDHHRKCTVVLKRWKRLGLLFWDESRAELLKSAHPEYARGWLLNVWN